MLQNLLTISAQGVLSDERVPWDWGARMQHCTPPAPEKYKSHFSLWVGPIAWQGSLALQNALCCVLFPDLTLTKSSSVGRACIITSNS